MLAHWPAQVDNPDASPSERVVAQRMADGLPVTVVSDSLTADDTGVWREQTTVVPRADAHRAVAALREADGDTVVFGSRTVWTDLMAHGLVDELYLLVGPAVVGIGIPAFDGVPPTRLRLLEPTGWTGRSWSCCTTRSSADPRRHRDRAGGSRPPTAPRRRAPPARRPPRPTRLSARRLVN
jgi:dihydrofolate reductase